MGGPLARGGGVVEVLEVSAFSRVLQRSLIKYVAYCHGSEVPEVGGWGGHLGPWPAVADPPTHIRKRSSGKRMRFTKWPEVGD